MVEILVAELRKADVTKAGRYPGGLDDLYLRLGQVTTRVRPDHFREPDHEILAVLHRLIDPKWRALETRVYGNVKPDGPSLLPGLGPKEKGGYRRSYWPDDRAFLFK